jgi:hypothetical protein
MLKKTVIHEEKYIISYNNNILIYYVYYVFITDKTNEAIKCEFYMYWVCKKLK